MPAAQTDCAKTSGCANRTRLIRNRLLNTYVHHSNFNSNITNKPFKALPAGNDVEMGGGSYNFEKIPEMVEAGEISIDVVNQAVSRQLRAKFKAGLFEDPFPGVPEEEQADYINTPESIDLARQLDAESLILLENHDNILPLRKDANIAVIGPMAHGYMNVGSSLSPKLIA